ncbi:MAG: FapA family protein, partial [Oscillospiraceae bacterium]|nr:FapA family protein [Oscillospiraceae bacterium]
RLPCPPAVSAHIPQGANILLAEGGLALTAGVDGILYIENDRFCIQEQKIIDGDLAQFQGTLQIAGNLYIGGNVDGGANITASGDIVIDGKIGQARVTSTEGIIRVQQGIYGTDGKTFLSAASQVQSPVVDGAEIEAGTSVIAETISNSVIHCGGTVYAMTGRGMIVSSRIWAGESILCLRVGNLAGGRSRFSVGYPPHIPEAWERIKAELAEAQSTIERLWEPIHNLRKKGSRISDREKLLLAQLAEQRELYTKRLEELKTDLQDVNKALEKRSKGRIRCEKLYPVLDVQIGRLIQEVITIEEKCNIHAEEGAIHLE